MGDAVARAYDEVVERTQPALTHGTPLFGRRRRRIDKMLDELVWMARVLRCGRDTVSSSDASPAMTCSACGTAMNQHAEKVDFASPNSADPVFYGTVQEIHQCRGCGNVQMRPAVDAQ